MHLSLAALQRDAMWVATRLAAWSGRSGQVYFEQRVDEYRTLWERVAVAAGGRLRPLARDLWEIEIGDARVRIRNHELPFDDPVSLALAGRKPVVHGLLSRAGIRVPEHMVFTLSDLGRAYRFEAEHPDGCVVKPASGFAGRGVTTHVRGRREVRRAAIRAAVHDSELLIEPMIAGEAYRLLVLEGRLVDAVWRRGPRVTGDGASTVLSLLARENGRRAGAGQPALAADRDLQFTLGYQGLDLRSSPAAGQVVVLKSIGDAGRFTDLRTVYTHGALDEIGPAVREDAERAAEIVGADLLGVDVITRDASVPLATSGGVINEVNTTPALHHHYDRSREAFPRIAPLILETLVRRDRARRASRGGSPSPSPRPG